VENNGEEGSEKGSEESSPEESREKGCEESGPEEKEKISICLR